MDNRSALPLTSRRSFLTTAGGVLAATAMPEFVSSKSSASAASQTSPPSATRGKLLIGVFDPVFADLTLDQMLDKVSSYGLEAMEIGTGGYPNTCRPPSW